MLLGYEYDIILAPVNTEKTTKQAEQNKYSFVVSNKASKDLIKKSIEAIFEVEVDKINVINTIGKVKRFKGKIGKRTGTRKAIVSVKKGQEINFTKLG